jgi:hypothetical protein
LEEEPTHEITFGIKRGREIYLLYRRGGEQDL